MAARMLAKVATVSASTPFLARSFQTSSRRLTDAVALPARKPVGAFRGGLFGFLLGSSLAGSGVYYYVVQEYRASNELLTEDIYALSNAIQRYTDRLASIEEKMEVLERKKK